MKRKVPTNPQRGLKTPLFILLAGVIGTLGVSGFSSAAIQTQQAPTLRIVSEDGNRLPVVIITGDDVRNLPAGENRIIQKFEGGNPATAAKVPTGKVTFFINNVQTNANFNLTKTGTGTLILPTANTYRGTTTVNDGVLNSTNNASLMKHGQGTLTLSGTSSAAIWNEQLILNGRGNAVAYEFRNIGPAELGRIFMPGETTSVIARLTGLRQITAQPSAKPAGPIARLILIPAKGTAKIEGWNPGAIKSATPGSEYECRDGACACDDAEDCKKLTSSGKCSSDLLCEGNGNNMVCGCTTR